MPGIAANTEQDRLKIGFAIGAGCLLGAPAQEIIFSICELLLAGGYKQQYDFARYLFDDLDPSVESDFKRRHTTFILAVTHVRNQCHRIFSLLEDYFTERDIDIANFNKFKQRYGDTGLIDLIISANECLIHFEICAQIPGMFSNVCIEHVSQMDVIKNEHFEALIPMLDLFINGYQHIPYPLDYMYNNVTLELEIEMPNDISPRTVSYRPLIRFLENIEPYRRSHLRVTLFDVRFDAMHYDCILNLKNILRRLNVISELRVEFVFLHVRVEGNHPLLRHLIMTRILSITNTKEINLPDMLWWRSRLDRDIRDVKLEENALYAPLLPVFASLASRRHRHSVEVLEQQEERDGSNCRKIR